MQIVGDQKDAALVTVTDGFDEIVEGQFAHIVNTLYWLIKHHQIRLADQGACQKDTLHFATRQRVDIVLELVSHTCFFQGGENAL